MTKPYYAVIFSSIKAVDDSEYIKTNNELEEIAKTMKGFLGVESARDELGVSVSYWETLDNIMEWKNNAKHQLAKQKGREKWYSWYKIRICKVEREYEFHKE